MLATIPACVREDVLFMIPVCGCLNTECQSSPRMSVWHARGMLAKIAWLSKWHRWKAHDAFYRFIPLERPRRFLSFYIYNFREAHLLWANGFIHKRALFHSKWLRQSLEVVTSAFQQNSNRLRSFYDFVFHTWLRR